MKNKTDKFIELAAMAMFYWGDLIRMARNLEKKQKTKVFAAEICLIASNGNCVYRVWTTKKTKRFIKDFEKNAPEGLRPEWVELIKQHGTVALTTINKVASEH